MQRGSSLYWFKLLLKSDDIHAHICEYFSCKNENDIGSCPIENVENILDLDVTQIRSDWVTNQTRRVWLVTQSPNQKIMFYICNVKKTIAYVLGFLTGKELYANRAQFSISQLCRDFNTTAGKASSRIKVPKHCIPWLIDIQIQMLGEKTCSQDDIYQCVDAFYKKKWKRFERNPYTALATLLLLMTIPNEKNVFELLPQRLRERHDWVMSRVIGEKNGRKKEILNAFFAFNFLDENILQFLHLPTSQVTWEDVEKFRQRFPHAEHAHHDWFAVPIWELQTNSLLFNTYPPRGDAHISALDISEWLWQKTCLVRQQGITLNYFQQQNDQNGETLLDGVRELALRYEQKHQIKMEKKAALTNVDDVVDIENLDQFLPPCVDAILGKNTAKSFPKDTARQHAVRVLARGQIPLSVIGQRLDDLNARFPHPQKNYPNAKARWDYQTHYQQGYAPPRCERMCGCPFSGNEKKAQCHELFAARHPRKYSHTHAAKFRDASAWFIWQFSLPSSYVKNPG